MNNLPNSKGVRCYFLCFWIEMGIMKPGSVVVNPTDFFELMDKMTEDEQNKYIKLIKGCTKRLSKIKDPTEVAYQAVVCGKENSNEVSITRYYSARLLQTKCAIPYFCSLFSVVLFVLLMCLGLIWKEMCSKFKNKIIRYQTHSIYLNLDSFNCNLLVCIFNLIESNWLRERE